MTTIPRKKPTRKKPTLMKKSGTSSTLSNARTQKSNGSLPNLPPLEENMGNITANTTANPNQLPNPKSSPNPNPSPKSATHGLDPSGKGTKGLAGIAAINAQKKYVKLQGDLTEFVASIGGGILILGMARQSETLQADSMVLMQHAEGLAEKLTNVARENDQVYKALAFLVSSSVYGALAMEVAAIAMGIAANHGVNVPGLPGSASTPNVYETLDSAGMPTAMTPDQWFAAKGA